MSSDAQSPLRGTPEHLLAAATCLIALLFAWVFIAVPDRLFADDSYFYFQVAWNFARGMGSTFNNLMPTNGYHPLWMLICALVFRVVPSRPSAVHAIATVISLLDFIMLLAMSRLLRRYADGLWPVAFLLLIPFVFGSQLGTEGALSGLFLILLMTTALRLVAEPQPVSASLFNLVAGIAVLSRLDNIFIVAFTSAAVYLFHDDTARTRDRRRLQLLTAPLPLALWAIYVCVNWIFFHTVQPISGMLKSGSARDHAIGTNLPHTALIALAIIIPCFLVVARLRRDTFFRVVEMPFALGVLCHAAYIVFIMSNETRWTWYYTSWILLASILLARTASILFAHRQPLAVAASVLSCLVLAGIWYKASFLKFYRGQEMRPSASFNAAVYEKAGIHRALAYDEPGIFAYYSNIQIVPVDGLMGDLKFQHDLATTGVKEFVEREHIDGFIGPDTPTDTAGKKLICDQIFLSSEQFHCDLQRNGQYALGSVDIYARLPKHNAGTLELDPENIVWSRTNGITVWRLKQ